MQSQNSILNTGYQQGSTRPHLNCDRQWKAGSAVPSLPKGWDKEAQSPQLVVGQEAHVAEKGAARDRSVKLYKKRQHKPICFFLWVRRAQSSLCSSGRKSPLSSSVPDVVSEGERAEQVPSAFVEFVLEFHPAKCKRGQDMSYGMNLTRATPVVATNGQPACVALCFLGPLPLTQNRKPGSWRWIFLVPHLLNLSLTAPSEAQASLSCMMRQ